MATAVNVLRIAYLLCVNILTFALMYSDKQKAKKKQQRIPESVLWGTAVIGGAAGAWLGMLMFRHKTRKNIFRAGLPALAVMQAIIIAALFDPRALMYSHN